MHRTRVWTRTRDIACRYLKPLLDELLNPYLELVELSRSRYGENCILNTSEQALLDAFDGHDVDGVRAAIAHGADVCTPIDGKCPIYWLLEQYERSDRLADCIRLLIDQGATLDDPAILPVLLDDAEAIRCAIKQTPSLLEHRTTLVSAFTSLVDVSLLHVAAEYGNLKAARALVDSGANLNSVAAIDEYGLNGHTPLFHCVNSIYNRSEPILRLLVDAGADTTIRVDGIVWGKGYPWETVFLDVTPISYAQMGLLPQMHRKEKEIYGNIATLLRQSGRKVPPFDNIPNRYLVPKYE